VQRANAANFKTVIYGRGRLIVTFPADTRAIFSDRKERFHEAIKKKKFKKYRIAVSCRRFKKFKLTFVKNAFF
jgi:Fe-S oxidoreductase